jgi:hypothetical protein
MQPQRVGELFNISTIQANHAIGARRGRDEKSPAAVRTLQPRASFQRLGKSATMLAG